MLRFCMVTTFYPPYSFGGDAIFVEALSRGLAEQGHEVDVIHCLDSYRALARATPREAAAGGLAQAAPAAQAAGVRVHRLRSRFGILSPLATQQTGRPWLKSAELRRLLEAKRFDVIHFHNVSLVGGPAVLRYGSALKLYTIHEHWLLCPMHTLFRDNRELCTEKRCFSCSLHYRRPPQLWRHGRLLARCVEQVDSFLAPTEFTRRIHLASGLPLRISVLESFHSPAAERSEALVPPGPFFLYAGRLERIKGVAALIAAFRAYRQADLLIAGEGGETSALQALAAGCDHIRFLGQVPRERLAGLVSRAIAVLVPSLGYEVFPLVVLEAFAEGTPVIARDRGSLAEIVHTSGGGLLFGDGAALEACLRRMQDDPALRRALGDAGRQAWQTRWTLEAHLRSYLSLIDRLARERCGPSSSPGRETGAA
jgi:glycosyltransferase involved in cell wall biosynthesis